MHLAGMASWEIREGIDYGLALALYVRDAAGLEPYVAIGQDVPRLQWGPSTSTPAYDLSAAVRQWPQWWSRAVAGPPEPPLLPQTPGWEAMHDLPTVRELAEQHNRRFWAWMKDVKQGELERSRALQLTHFVNAYEGRLGRPVRPFSLHVRLLPVSEALGWVLDGQSVLVTTGLRDDLAALEAFLDPVVSALA